jgi:hypothetical protein
MNVERKKQAEVRRTLLSLISLPNNIRTSEKATRWCVERPFLSE